MPPVTTESRSIASGPSAKIPGARPRRVLPTFCISTTTCRVLNSSPHDGSNTGKVELLGGDIPTIGPPGGVSITHIGSRNTTSFPPRRTNWSSAYCVTSLIPRGCTTSSVPTSSGISSIRKSSSRTSKVLRNSSKKTPAEGGRSIIIMGGGGLVVSGVSSPMSGLSALVTALIARATSYSSNRSRSGARNESADLRSSWLKLRPR